MTNSLGKKKSPISAFRLEENVRNKTREMLEENISEHLYKFWKKDFLKKKKRQSLK